MTGIRGTGMSRDALPHNPYAWKGEPEPPAVTAMRERYRAHDAELDALAAEREQAGDSDA